MTVAANGKRQSLKAIGLDNLSKVFWNSSSAELYEEAVRRYEGLVGHLGPLIVRTGQYTGRLPKDKFIIRDPGTSEKVWWGKINQPMDPPAFEALRHRMSAYLEGKDVFVQNCYAGADERFRIPLRFISESATHALFARNLFIRELNAERLANFRPEYTILHAPHFQAVPESDATHSDAFVLLHFSRKLILIGGTSYAGEIKKSVFTLMNYLLPEQGVLPMHCSANFGSGPDDVAVFFGLSGTGKTTLSSAPDRTLIGDDEHGWSDQGIFNFEGGCYAKVIRLSREAEPEIFETTRRFGTILENVAIDAASRSIDLDDASLTENTRAAYPLTHLPNISETGVGGHPKNLIFLSCDAFGVLPPVARLTRDQAMFYFLSGYTAKVAGTETGVREPQATFSACFGAPFLPLPPSTYGNLLREKIDRHHAHVWLVNTGWTSGPYGNGHRIPISATRAIVNAILTGSLQNIDTRPDPIFRLQVPVSCPGVAEHLLNPRQTWKNPVAYDRKARELASLFHRNFSANAPGPARELEHAGPLVS